MSVARTIFYAAPIGQQGQQPHLTIGVPFWVYTIDSNWGGIAAFGSSFNSCSSSSYYLRSGVGCHDWCALDRSGAPPLGGNPYTLRIMPGAHNSLLTQNGAPLLAVIVSH
jgi:hypothetical protein